MQYYKTIMHYKKSRRKVTINTGLTKKQAIAEVQEDIKINPEAKTKMLCFHKDN